MYYHFCFKDIFDLKTDYDQYFGEYIGNNFVNAIQDCFWGSSFREEVRYYRSPWSRDMLFTHFMDGVFGVFELAKEQKGKHLLEEMFEPDRKSAYTMENETSRVLKDGEHWIYYKNVERQVAHAMIWAAYFYASIQAEVEKIENTGINYQRIKEMLYKFQVSMSGYADADTFEEHHNCHRLYEEYFCPTLQKIMSLKRPRNTMKEYFDDPVYGLCYDSILENIHHISLSTDKDVQEADCLRVFIEAENCVNRVLKAEYPEFEIGRVYVYLNKKFSKTEETGTMIVRSVDKRLYFIASMFLIAVHDLIPDMNSHVMTALDCICEEIELNFRFDFFYITSIWKLVRERFPLQKKQKSI